MMVTKSIEITDRHKKLLLILSLIGAFLSILISSAVYEDAYITFRVVENFIDGHGLRWNLDERVQVYTHPLWLLLHIPFQAVLGNIFMVSLVLSWLCVAATFWLSWRFFRAHDLLWAGFFVLPFVFSKTLAGYSASGFENPLLHLLFAAFMWVFFFVKKDRWFYLSLITALSLLTRLDTIVFYAPLWLILLASKGGLKVLRQVIPGLFPIILWELFSLFYYGSLLPNTAYARIQTGIDNQEYLRLGMHYLLNLFAVDVFSALLLLVAAAAAVIHGRHYFRNQPGAGIYFGIAVSVLCYAIYIILVGGTYLSGRLFSLPVFASLYLLCHMVHQANIRQKRMPMGGAVMLLVGFLAFAVYPSDVKMATVCKSCFVGVDKDNWEQKIEFVDWVAGTEKLPQFGVRKIKQSVAIIGSIGVLGYETDTRVKVLDPIGLSDPLMARLPTKIRKIPSMGMLSRNVPKGYPYASVTGDISRMPEELGRYYAPLRMIVSGPLWSKERLTEIVRFNLGEYDGHLENYIQATARQPISRRQ
ncbi:MAG: hypothetical protein AB7L92_00365 [Alphaproteobacteria bacterium]